MPFGIRTLFRRDLAPEYLKTPILLAELSAFMLPARQSNPRRDSSAPPCSASCWPISTSPASRNSVASRRR